MANDWHSKGIKVKDLEEKIRKGDIQIPAYQRGVVWSETMQKDLIDSIKNGYPFGSLVIYSYDNPSNGTTKPDLLIDGLQRSTALFKFVNNPSQYFDVTDIDDSAIEYIKDKMGTVTSESAISNEIKQVIIEWIKSFTTSAQVGEMNEFNCAIKISQHWPILYSHYSSETECVEDLSIHIKPMLTKYKELCRSIEDREIPYIEITGDDSKLSVIFRRINEKGVKLNKQNIFAATWSNSPIKITNDKLYPLVDITKARYDKIQADGATIYNYDSVEFDRKKELDIFEISYSFGKYISKQYPELFAYKDDKVLVDMYGFYLINACLFGKVSELKDMNLLLLSKFDAEHINTFLVKILSCVKYVDELLGPVTKFKSNKRLNKSPLHTDYQIVSLIASIFILKHVSLSDDGEHVYDLSRTNQIWNDEYDELIRKNALKKYIYDIVDGVWGSHGDSSLDDIIANNPQIYTKEISKEDFELCIKNWYNRQKGNRVESIAKEVAAPKEVDKILLNLIYSNSLPATAQLNIEKFDIEHLATKKLMEKKIKEYGGKIKLPISSFGNICLLPEYPNRKKKDQIIYDDKEYVDGFGNTLSITDIETIYTFTNYDDMSWLKENLESAEEFQKKYLSFIDKRFNILLEKITNILYR